MNKNLFHSLLVCLVFACKDYKTNKTSSKNSTSSIEKTDTMNVESKMQAISQIELPKNTNYMLLNNVTSEAQFLQFEDNILYYFGTSDDFDDAREGYLPGYFTAKAKELTGIENRFSFTLNASEIEFYKQQEVLGISPPENTIWDTVKLKGKRTYKATIKGDTILIKTKGFDTRKFVKTNAG